MLKFIGGARRVVNGDWSGFGGLIMDRHAEIEDILYQTGTKIELVVVTSGTSDLAAEPKRELEEFCSQMNDSTDIASYVYLNQERLYAMLTATRAAQIDLSVNLRNWGSYQEAGCVAYYGTASAQGSRQVVPGPRGTPLLPQHPRRSGRHRRQRRDHHNRPGRSLSVLVLQQRRHRHSRVLRAGTLRQPEVRELQLPPG